MKVVPTGIDPTLSNYSEAAGVLLFWGDLVLLCKRIRFDSAGNIPAYAGYWSPFAGGIEEGETPLEAAVRELEEESGLSILSSRLEYINPIKQPHSIFHLYAVELEDHFTPILDCEHTEYGYFKTRHLRVSPQPLCSSIITSIEFYNQRRLSL